MRSGTLADMCAIVREGAGGKLRYFARADTDSGEVTVLHIRDDLEWNEQRERGILPALPEIVADFREYMRQHDVEFISLEM